MYHVPHHRSSVHLLLASRCDGISPRALQSTPKVSPPCPPSLAQDSFLSAETHRLFREHSRNFPHSLSRNFPHTLSLSLHRNTIAADGDVGRAPRSARTVEDEQGFHTVSVRIHDKRGAATPQAAGAAPSTATSLEGTPITLRLEACGLGPRNVMGRGASVYYTTKAGNSGVDDDAYALVEAQQGERWDAWAEGLPRMYGVLPTLLEAGSEGSRNNGSQQRQPLASRGLRGRPSLPPSAATTPLRYSGTRGGGTDDVIRGGTPMARGSNGRRLQLEECASDCLRADPNNGRCENDPDCEFGGLGCNAENDELCRYCGFGSFADCEVTETLAPAPTPSPTADPSRVPCSSGCLESATQTCFDDPTCPNGYVGVGSGIGCNANGDTYCRFCGFNDFNDCPDGTPTLGARLLLFLLALLSNDGDRAFDDVGVGVVDALVDDAGFFFSVAACPCPRT